MTKPHAILRAHQRYGLSLTEADLRAMQAMVLRRDANVLIVHQQAERTFVVIRWAGVCLYAIVSAVGSVVTFLPSSAGRAPRPAPTGSSRKRRNSARPANDRQSRRGEGRELRYAGAGGDWE